MKKLLNISVIAALAVLPMAANATPVAGDPTHSDAASGLTTDAQPKWALAEANASVDGNVATAGYVKGAYNAAMKAINTIADTAGNALTASSTATLTNKSIDANGTGNNITNLETDNFATGVIVTEVGATGADTALPTEQAVREAITTATTDMVTTTGSQTLTNKTISGATITGGTIDADSTSISNLEADNFKSGVVVDSTTGIAATGSASDDKLVTEKAVAAAIAGATTGAVTETRTQTLTNKTIDADDNTISDLEADNFKSGVVVNSTTGIAATGSASDDKLVTEKAVASAIEDFATQAGVKNTIETATIAATVPTLTAWGDDTSTGTVNVTVSSISATYAEPSNP